MRKNRCLLGAVMFLGLVLAGNAWSQHQPGQAHDMGAMKGHGQDMGEKADQPSGEHQMGGMKHGGGMGGGMGGMCPKMGGGKKEGMGGGMMKKGMMGGKMGRHEKMEGMPSHPGKHGARFEDHGLMGLFHGWVRKLMSHREAFGFTPEQMKQFDEAISGHFAAAIRSGGELKALKVELKYALRTRPEDLPAAEALLRKIGDRYLDLHMEGIRLYGRLLQILTPAQKEKVEDLIGNPFAPPWKKGKRMAGPHHRMGDGEKGKGGDLHTGHYGGSGSGHEMRHGEEQPDEEEFFEEMEEGEEMEHGTEKAQRM